jgi:hypothetical protein
MLFDDDDSMSAAGLNAVLEDCARDLPEGCLGYIYHLADHSGRQLGTSFPVSRANFLELRADMGVSGDKKEVVLASALRQVCATGSRRFRRVPTSLWWSRLALTGDVICKNVVVGQKHYLVGGLSDNIELIKRLNAYPMMQLNWVRLQGYVRRRYQSRGFLIRALVGLGYYSMLSFGATIRDLFHDRR